MNNNGLSSSEVEYRLNNNLVNNEKNYSSRSFKSIFLTNLISLFNFIHFILFILVLTTGSIMNATFIIVILFNVLISIYQEIKAKIILDRLKVVDIYKIRVIRDGKIKMILPSEIVMDDLLYLKQGDNLVVDATIIETKYCEVDESIITGESNPIIKNKNDKLISGSIIVCGEVYAKVVSINKNTYTNKLIKEASKNKDDSSYLKYCINSILKVVTFLIIPVGFLLFMTQFYFSKQTYNEAILSTVAGIIGMIPQGLVLLTSISLTVGVVKMASKKVIVQKLNGIELLACIDILCLDKTGTITDGSMTVKDVIQIDYKVNIKKIVSNMIKDKINLTDIALVNYFGMSNDLEIFEHIPFSSNRKYTLSKFKNGIFALGAYEFLIDENIDNYSILNKYINKGYRIITLVKCNGCFNKKTNTIVAFIILKDNIRKNVKKTFEYLEKQGVDIKIISGDNPKIISNILKQLDFNDCDRYINGYDLPTDLNELKNIVNNYNIYGRVSPYQKQLIIKALKFDSKVGMIGDGVNDILALKEADCGIALSNGISAPRSVSEIILNELDFKILIDIINEGRRVVNNIERVSSMYLVKTIYSFLLSILCIVISHEYPFYPIQLTLISAMCVGIPSFFLTLEPNYNKVKKGFLIKVFRNALPSGICVFVNILFIILFSYILKLDFDLFRFVIVVITGYINLRLLYKVSLPLSIFRKILLIVCSLFFIILLILFHNFFLINSYNLMSFCFLIVLIYINNYIIDFFEEIYDKIVLWIQKYKKEKD